MQALEESKAQTGDEPKKNFLIEKLFLVQKRIKYGKIYAIFDRSNACHT
jgi:hypothetical protein